MQKTNHEKSDVQEDTTTNARKTPGVDPNMPLMKNAEIYTSLNGTIYLIGGKFHDLLVLWFYGNTSSRYIFVPST